VRGNGIKEERYVLKVRETIPGESSQTLYFDYGTDNNNSASPELVIEKSFSEFNYLNS
jgi:hypothetical protein